MRKTRQGATSNENRSEDGGTVVRSDSAPYGWQHERLEEVTAANPDRRSFTALRWPDADADTLKRLIDLKPWENEGVDVIHIEWTEPETKTPVSEILGDAAFTGNKIEKGRIFSFHFATYLFPSASGTWFNIKSASFKLPLPYDEKLVEDNEARGFLPSPELRAAMLHEEQFLAEAGKQNSPQIESAIEFAFHTSQEMYALSSAQADGKTGNGYQRNDQAGAIIHQRTGSPHMIRMELTDAERTSGLALDYLETLARSQDADAVLTTAYILGVLAPPPHLAIRPYAGGWIDFDDVLKKIGWYPQTTKDRREMHAKIWSFIQFGERAHIIGKRTGPRYKLGDEEIDTSIHGAAWRVMKTETPDKAEAKTKASDQLTLYPIPETPVRAEIVVSKELTALITNPKVAQYFQCGEILGAIPNGKPAGAWARVIGLALLSFWRRKPREHSVGVLKPTRRELLDHLAAKITPYDEILAGDKPGRAIEYWCSALQILADEGFIEKSGEALISAKEMRAVLPRQNWKDIWLDQTVTIEVGPRTKPAFEKVLQSLPALKPRQLAKKPRTNKKPPVS